jgi:hypothetical protein
MIPSYLYQVERPQDQPSSPRTFRKVNESPEKFILQTSSFKLNGHDNYQLTHQTQLKFQTLPNFVIPAEGNTETISERKNTSILVGNTDRK